MALSDKKQAFLEWLTETRKEGETQRSYADAIGLDPSRLGQWKAEPEFVKLWDERMRAQAGHPERLAVQLEVLHEIATGYKSGRQDSDRIRAVTSYWGLLSKSSPSEGIVSRSLGPKDVAELSNDELLAAARELNSRASPPEPKAVGSATSDPQVIAGE